MCLVGTKSTPPALSRTVKHYFKHIKVLISNILTLKRKGKCLGSRWSAKSTAEAVHILYILPLSKSWLIIHQLNTYCTYKKAYNAPSDSKNSQSANCSCNTAFQISKEFLLCKPRETVYRKHVILDFEWASALSVTLLWLVQLRRQSKSYILSCPELAPYRRWVSSFRSMAKLKKDRGSGSSGWRRTQPANEMYLNIHI